MPSALPPTGRSHGAAPPVPKIARISAAERVLALAAVAALASPGAARAVDAAAGAARPDCDAAAPTTVLHPAAPDLPRQARAVFLDAARLLWTSDQEAKPAPPLEAIRDASRRPDAGVAGAPGFRHVLLHSAGGRLSLRPGARPTGVDAAVPLRPAPDELPPDKRWLGAGVALTFASAADARRLPTLLRGQLVLAELDAAGTVRRATGLQTAAALDALHAAAATDPVKLPALGATVERRAAAHRTGTPATAPHTRFTLWAPTAQAVWLCLHATPDAPAAAPRALRRDAATGAWSVHLPGDRSGAYYRYVVQLQHDGIGRVRHLVTDPYAVSLSADSRLGFVADLSAPALKPPGWDAAPRPPAMASPTQMVIYELHVRDFSVGDASVPARDRGRFLAFTHAGSAGMRHLRALREAGVTDVHLLPVYDFATVPERGCRAEPGAPRAADCFNWGYDPWHFNAPEGSYAVDPDDGAARIVELRRMVAALHATGLRVGMDVVYNHVYAAGADPKSVLDRIVPGYYLRRGAAGDVETSTCCPNTATEHAMMERLMSDSVLLWAREHRIDSFRFDLMGHQPKAAMLRLQRRLNAAVGRPVQLIGEGWNFGEVADGRRFEQAAQGRLAGSGIATFSDRARDGLRGGSPGDGSAAGLQAPGWVSGLADAQDPVGRAAAVRAADWVRAGLAGTLADFEMPAGPDARPLKLSALDYNGQGAGYASQPDEVVNYAENHDNLTLFDALALKLPPGTPARERARAQTLAAAVVAFSPGVAYFHAGQELLRSKSLDGNSYDSGDAFNRLDFTAHDNGLGPDLPPEPGDAGARALRAARLADASIRPAPVDIAWARDAFLDLLRIRGSTPLLRLRSADEVRRHLTLPDVGDAARGRVVAAVLDARGRADLGPFGRLVVLLNAAATPQRAVLPAVAGWALAPHPVHTAPGAADPRPAQTRIDVAAGVFEVPARTAVVFVMP